MHARLIWLMDTAWPGINERRARLLDSVRASTSILILESPPARRLPDLAIRGRDGVAIGQVMPLLNTRVSWARAALRMWPMRTLAEQAAIYQVAGRVRASGWADRDGSLIVVCSSIFLHRAARSLRPDQLVLEISHDPRRAEGAPPWTEELLVDAALDADVVVTSSVGVAKDLRRAGVQDVQLWHGMPGMDGIDLLVELLDPHGGGVAADDSTGAVGETPAVEFRGQIGPSINFALVDELAQRCPELFLRLVGPVDPSVAEEAQELGRRPNVQLQREAQADHLRSVAGTPSVAIFPLVPGRSRLDTLPSSVVAGVSPGVPIVSTIRPETSRFPDAVDVCPSAEAFVQTVRLRTRHRVARSLLRNRPRPMLWVA